MRRFPSYSTALDRNLAALCPFRDLCASLQVPVARLLFCQFLCRYFVVLVIIEKIHYYLWFQ
jgi:hypothetical protein